MVKRKVKLAQVVCAVYSLNKPSGVTKREIIKFCRKRFGCNCPTKEFNSVIERALDEGLLTSFHRRFLVTKLRHGILWAGDSWVERSKKRTVKRIKKRNTGVIYHRKRFTARKNNKTFPRKKVILEDCIKNTSTFYKVWKQERNRQMAVMKNKIRKASKRRKSHSKIVNSGTKIEGKRKAATGKEFRKSKLWKIGRVKKLNSKRNTKMKQSRKRAKNCVIKRSSKNTSSTQSMESASQRERYRSLFRQTKYAVVHAKSWDRLNYSRQEKIRENKEMVKNSQLVQKILTQKHAASWDDLNSKLKDMKKAGCNGDGASQHSASVNVASS